MRTIAIVVVAGFVSALLVAGCLSSSTPAVTPEPTPAPTPTARPSATPRPATPGSTPMGLPSATAWGPAVLVTGWETCRISMGSMETNAEGITMMREGTVVCFDETNDPRVNGTVIGTARGDFWGPHADDTAGVTWGDLRLENDGGTWIGTYTGAYTSETGDMFLIWYEGTGDYEGLAYFQWVTPAVGEVVGGTEFVGLIFPGSPPPR